MAQSSQRLHGHAFSQGEQPAQLTTGRAAHCVASLRLLMVAGLLFIAVPGTAAADVQPDAGQKPAIDHAFSPDGGATDLIVRAIASAQKTIRVAAYSFTSKPIAAALVEARARGVDVDLVMDHEEIEERNHSIAPWLAQRGIPVRVDIMHALQHDKYMVIDGDTVETGSFNYTAAAEHHNAENVLVLHHMPDLAAAYAANWQALWDQAEVYSSR